MIRSIERAFVWAGGAMFVGSLGTTVWMYARWFRDVTPGSGWAAVLCDGLLVSVFALHHSVFARDGVKRAVGRLVAERLLRSVYVWVASLLLFMVCVLWRRVGGSAYHVAGAQAWLFTLGQLAGLLVTARSVLAIHPLELAGINTATRVETLQMNGTYGVVRHPLYLGWVLLVFGSPHMTGDRLVFAGLTTLYLVMAIPWEERSLERTFGERYRQYKARVRWRVLPYLY